MPATSDSHYPDLAHQALVLKEEGIEDAYIEKLRSLKYTFRPDIRDRASLEKNFREKFEALNRVRLTDDEFKKLLAELVTSDVFTNASVLRQKNDFIRDDGTPLAYTLVNVKDWCKNDFEVIHQLRINTDYSHHRYDVILLINGVPVAQVELKTLGVNPRRAMEQIVEYKNDPGNGYTRTLLCFIQLFIVSNRTDTIYFANNNARHFAFNADERFLPVYRFADKENKPINHLDDFADRFLQKCELGRMISRYMVLIQSEQKLLMMRPYQIYAVQAIVDCIEQNCGNGYIWHTTGSGKTLTSFKASTLLKENDQIDKCLFVVDRKDLDRQTREEFNRFQEGCVEENTHTGALVRRMLSDDKSDKVIVCTIQKLGLALVADSTRNRQKEKQGKATYKEQLEPLRDKRMVFIFDECHRSQFGENHKAIKEFFPRAQLFGFTGTPIFEQNATRVQIEGEQASVLTTDDLFQRCLHQYTITHAIEDKNVLRFHVDYYKVAGASSSEALPPSKGEQDAPATLWEYFNPQTEIDIRTGGNLPHWEQGAVWYFITFRLADSLPKAVVEEIKQQRELWMQRHDRGKLSPEDLAEYYRLFSERYESLLNSGSGSCVLRDVRNAEIVHGALRHFDGQRYVLDEYVVMPNHVHVLVKPLAGHGLADILHSWKSFTANQINKRLGRAGQLWQHESYDHIVRHDRAMEAIRRYIRENPKVAGASRSEALPPSKREQDAPATPSKREQDAPATKRAIVEAILDKHATATHLCRFNALFATASINDAIEYHGLFQAIQAERATDPQFIPLKIACVFSPPADGDPDVKQLQEDLLQEKADNEQEPEKKKDALKSIIKGYNDRYGTNHSIGEFDLYYQDIQKRIKDQQFPNADLPRKGDEKIDVTIVVDMLLTGFDSKYLNTLYVDKNLKHHGLIQAFSRTNRVLNATKPHGQILDFRAQQKPVDEAIALFSGVPGEGKAREIWLVEAAPKVVEKLKTALNNLGKFMESQGLEPKPEAVPALKGDAARAAFIERFREVQRLKTQLDQYTDLAPETEQEVEQLLPKDELNAFRGVYLATAQDLKDRQGKGGDKTPSPVIEELDFEFVLFASAIIDYDYIMKLLANFSAKTPSKQTMNREQLIGLIQADAKFMDERDTITDYVRTLKAGQGLEEKEIRAGYQSFKAERHAAELAAVAQKHGLATDRLQTFVDAILQRMVFDGEQLTELMQPLGLGWRERRVKELALMDDLVPLLKKRAAGRDISGLNAYE